MCLTQDIESDPRCTGFFRRKTLCKTLAGNRCDLITISAVTTDPDELQRRRGIVISARVHPGETNASWMMQVGLCLFHSLILSLSLSLYVLPVCRCDLCAAVSSVCIPRLRHLQSLLSSAVVCQGVLRFLTGFSPEAQYLRQHFIFKIVPMLNPDGVIAGNYRCSLAGVDLNRRWRNPKPDLHPTIVAMKAMMQRFCSDRPVQLFCDLHGHSRLYNIFL